MNTPSFNTKGEVKGEVASSGKASSAADPPLSELDALQLLLDLGGMVPGAGAIADLLNAAISAARGDWLGMALSIFSAAPAVGDAAALAKIAKNAPKYAEALAVVEAKVLPKLPDRIAQPLKDFIGKAKAKLDEMAGPKKEPSKPEPPKKEPESAKKGGNDTQVRKVNRPRRPNEKKWKEKGGSIKENPDGSTTYTTKDGVSVTYSKEGYPDFSSHSVAEVKANGLSGEYGPDSKLANSQIGLQKTPNDYVWHHVEDGKTMQLIPKNVHKAFPHTGGSSVIRNGM